MSTEVSRNGNSSTGSHIMVDDQIAIDLPLSIRRRWCVLDLDDLVEAIAAAGLPREVLVVHREGPCGGHRVMHRWASRRTAA
jgi:hypothetical protein